MQPFFDNLVARLKAAPNLSEVARRAGVNPRTLSRARDGHDMPTMRTVIKVVAALDALDREALQRIKRTRRLAAQVSLPQERPAATPETRTGDADRRIP